VASLRADVCLRHVSGQTKRPFELSNQRTLPPNFWFWAFASVAQLSDSENETLSGKDLPPLTPLPEQREGRSMGLLCSFPEEACTASGSASKAPQDFSPTGNRAQSLHPWAALSGTYPTIGALQSNSRCSMQNKGSLSDVPRGKVQYSQRGFCCRVLVFTISVHMHYDALRWGFWILQHT